MEKDNELKGVGNSLDFGARMYDSRIARWISPDPKDSKFPSSSPYHFGYNNPIVTIDIDGKENIVVVGEQNDNSSGNKLMFAHQAISKLREYAKSESEETRTMVIFTDGYSSKQLSKIEQQATKLGATFVKVKSSDELVSYINTKSTASSEKITKLREVDKVSNVDAFAHGVVGSIEFGYKMENAGVARFDGKAASKLNPESFKANAEFVSYACRTGLGNSNINRFAWPKEDLMQGKSLAQSISNAAKITVNAYMVRSDYSNTLSSQKDRLALKGYLPLPPGTPTTGGLTLRQLNERVANREDVDGATFDAEGAVHPVESGTTPSGVDRQMQTYTPE